MRAAEASALALHAELGQGHSKGFFRKPLASLVPKGIHNYDRKLSLEPVMSSQGSSPTHKSINLPPDHRRHVQRRVRSGRQALAGELQFIWQEGVMRREITLYCFQVSAWW